MASQTDAPFPGILVLALMLSAVMAARALRGPRPLERFTAEGLLALTTLTFVVRQLVLPTGFVHQNGQGPLWVSFSLGHPSVYGPGYFEIFGWLHNGTVEPSWLVFSAQAVVGALAPALTYALARQLGASRLLSWPLAIVVAADPVLGRIAQSESYFAVCTSLGLAAGVAVATGARQRPWAWSLVAFTAAALFVAQAARVQPLAWPALALTPLAALLTPGILRPRLARAGVVTAIIAAVVLLTSADVMSAAYFELRRDWLLRTATTPWLLVLASCAVVVWLARAKRDAMIRVGALLLTAAVIPLSFPATVFPLIDAAHTRLFLAPLLIVTAAILAHCTPEGPRWRVCAVAAFPLLALPALWLLGPSPWWQPTDVREQAWILTWAESLPADRVFFVGRQDDYVLSIPLYGEHVPGQPTASRLDDAELPPVTNYYYRSSLCSTVPARTRCAAIEGGRPLSPLYTKRLPAIPSMTDQPYDRQSIEVGLYQVEAP